MALHYRKDIDGLRAVAVLLVIVFHVHPRHFSGGFTGVDVFFVISGFLITGLIRDGLEAGRFSLLDFYMRRIRRIFPALIVVLVTCATLGWVILFPTDYHNLGKHIAGSAAFIANFTLYLDAGYFDAPSELKPVLHLWSLGVEEQFYILWPALVLLAWRWRGAAVKLAVAVLVASFATNLWLTATNPGAAFFLPTSRFWELMIGCVLALARPDALVQAFASKPWATDAGRIRDGMSIAGIALIAAGLVLIRGDHAFPGWWALLPTIGAALVIAAGPGAVVNNRLLSRPAFVYVGLISYPLYLWHWPALALLRHYHFKEPSDLMRWGAVALAFVLADLTYRFVERPIRGGANLAVKPIAAAIAMTVIGLAGTAVYLADGFRQRFPRDIAALFSDEDNVARTFVGSGRCVRGVNGNNFTFANDCDIEPGANSRLVVVWGDSHAANLTRGLAEIERARGDFRLVFFNTVGCPPVPSYRFVEPTLPNCAAANRTAVARIAVLKPGTVILAGNWSGYDGGKRAGLVDEHSIREVVGWLRSVGVGHVVGVGQFPLWRYAVPKIVAREYRTGRAIPDASGALPPLLNGDFVEARTYAADDATRRWFKAAGADFLSPLATLCSDGRCLLTVPDRVDPMNRDADHFTNAGSVWFAARNENALVGRRP